MYQIQFILKGPVLTINHDEPQFVCAQARTWERHNVDIVFILGMCRADLTLYFSILCINKFV